MKSFTRTGLPNVGVIEIQYRIGANSEAMFAVPAHNYRQSTSSVLLKLLLID